MSAAAATSGTETLSGTIVFAAVPGTNSRTVISSVVRARGVFRSVGRVVEIVPPDPAGVSQDDLVFRSGTMHVVSTPGALLSVRSTRTAACSPGRSSLPGRDAAPGSSTTRPAASPGRKAPWRFLARNPDGSCSLTQMPRHEVDKFAENGTLLF